MEEFEAAGYGQYEISNYAREGRECLHNLGYWRGADYAGLGPSAVSTRSGWRRKNVADTSAYTQRVLSGEDRFENLERLDKETLRAEKVSLGLRTREGVETTELDDLKIRQLESGGLVRVQDGRAALTREGRLVADGIAVELA
jgi:oxygen-independent coproporphyrinogen-3 oxidase